MIVRSHTPRNLVTNTGKKNMNSKDLAAEKAALKETKASRKSKKIDTLKPSNNGDILQDFS